MIISVSDLENALAVTQAGLAAAREAARHTPDIGQAVALRRHLVAPGPHGHAWTVGAAEAAHPAALAGMHVAAHVQLWHDCWDALEEARAEVRAERQPPQDDSPLAVEAAYLDAMDPGFAAMWDRYAAQQATLCAAEFTTGPLHDPYGTMCDKGGGHYPHTRHGGPDPFGAGGRVEWDTRSHVFTFPPAA